MQEVKDDWGEKRSGVRAGGQGGRGGGVEHQRRSNNRGKRSRRGIRRKKEGKE